MCVPVRGGADGKDVRREGLQVVRQKVCLLELLAVEAVDPLIRVHLQG